MTTLGSSEYKRLVTFLNDFNYKFIAEIRPSRSSSVNFALFVPSSLVAEHPDRLNTSRRQMALIKNSIRRHLDITVEWIITQAEHVAALEASLLELLENKFPGVVGSVFISNPKTPPVWVWIEPNPNALELPDIPTFSHVCAGLFKLFDIEAPAVLLADNQQLPSNPKLLRLVKKYAPISSDELYQKMQTEGMAVPNLRWVHTKLDTMRRNGLLIWSSNEKYALTDLALGSVAHGKYRGSSDIERALALARRQW